MSPYNPQLTAILRKAGWKEGRDESEIEQEYQKVMGDAWVPQAAPFVRSFGNLEIDRRLWVFTKGAVLGLPVKSRVEKVIGCSGCPVAFSGYVGDGAHLWIDSKGRFYVVDSEGIMFVGSNTEEALNVLLLNAPRPLPPEDIRSSIERAYEWNKN